MYLGTSGNSTQDALYYCWGILTEDRGHGILRLGSLTVLSLVGNVRRLFLGSI